MLETIAAPNWTGYAQEWVARYAASGFEVIPPLGHLRHLMPIGTFTFHCDDYHVTLTRRQQAGQPDDFFASVSGITQPASRAC